MNKRIICFITIAFLVTANFFSGDFTSYEKELFGQIMDFRLELKTIKDKNETLKTYDEYWKKLNSAEVQTNITEEMKNIMDNIYISERNGILKQINPDTDEMKEQILAQYEKISTQQYDIPVTERNPYLVSSSGDLTTEAMKYLPKTQLLKQMKQGLELYDEVIKVYPHFSPILSNLGIMAYMTPELMGGNKEKGLKYMEDSYVYSAYDFEKYNYGLMYSQVLFEEKKFEKSKEVFSTVQKILPEDEYVQLTARVNEAGYSLFEYMMHKDKIERKMKKSN